MLSNNYFCHITEFFPPAAHALIGHMISNNKIVSGQTSLSGQQCKIYDIRG